MPKVHLCNEHFCNRVIPFSDRYCNEHAQLHQQERFEYLAKQDRTDYYKHYNQEVRPEESSTFYNSTQWKKVSEYVRQRDMMTSGVTGKVLDDHDCITDHIVRRDLCSNPLDTSNLWLLSRQQHYYKTQIEENIAKSPNGDNKLKHISREWWINAIKERITKYGR